MWIDSHNHHYFSSLNVLDSLRRSGLEAVVEASWIPVRPGSWETLEDVYRWIVEAEAQRLSKIGLRLLPGLGVHPRCIPPRINIERLEAWLQDERVKALGEVGLETGSEEEKEAFVSQLKVAEKLDKPAIVHTPRTNKLQVASLELKLIRESGFPEEMVVVDHFNAELLSGLEKGSYMIGLSLQPGKLSVSDALKLVETLDSERVMINSDSSTEPSEPAWGLELLKELEKRDKQLARRLGTENAARFYRA
ncbi:MAG: TatD family hydrolase [Nitrososphaeria archaeon]